MSLALSPAVNTGAGAPNAELLAQLRDIQTAPPAPFWPPAPGWWLLAALALLFLLWLARRGLQAWRVRRRRAHWIDQLRAVRAAHDPGTAPAHYLAGVNRLLKVAAMGAFPGQGFGGLQGEAWVQFLAPSNPGDTPLAALANGPYEAAPDFDVDALEQAARDWLQRHG